MLKQKLQQEQINALKAKESVKVNILRYILSKIKNKEIEKKEELTDEEIIIIIKKIVKELKESIEAFKKGKREDLVKESEKQLEIASLYLPKELSDEQIKEEIEKIIAQNKDLYDKNPKAIIGICMKNLRSKADSERIMKILSLYVKN